MGADEERYIIFDAASQRVTLYQSRQTVAEARRPSRSKSTTKVFKPQSLMQLSVLGRNLQQIFPGPSWMSLPRQVFVSSSSYMSALLSTMKLDKASEFV